MAPLKAEAAQGAGGHHSRADRVQHARGVACRAAQVRANVHPKSAAGRGCSGPPLMLGPTNVTSIEHNLNKPKKFWLHKHIRMGKVPAAPQAAPFHIWAEPVQQFASDLSNMSWPESK